MKKRLFDGQQFRLRVSLSRPKWQASDIENRIADLNKLYIIL
jgi:hypothetical protein